MLARGGSLEGKMINWNVYGDAARIGETNQHQNSDLSRHVNETSAPNVQALLPTSKVNHCDAFEKRRLSTYQAPESGLIEPAIGSSTRLTSSMNRLSNSILSPVVLLMSELVR